MASSAVAPIHKFREDKATNLKINEKFKHFFLNEYLFVVYYGGRSSGKSCTAAIAVITIMLNEPGSICVASRQFAATLESSCKAELDNAIQLMNVGHLFHQSTSKQIKAKNGSVCSFLGLDRNKSNNKSFSNIRVLWIEEASDVTDQSWKFLIPTVARNEGAQIFCTFNPELESDWVYRNFIDEVYDNAVVTKINYDENAYNNAQLYRLIAADKRRDYDEYMHVWEGFPRTSDKTTIIQARWFDACIGAADKLGIDVNGPVVYGFDVADENGDANGFVARQGFQLEYCEEFFESSPNKAAEKVFNMHLGKDVNSKVPSADKIIFDSIGVGAGAKGEFRRLHDLENNWGKLFPDVIAFNAGKGVDNPTKKYNDGVTNKEFFANVKAQAWFSIRDKMQKTHDWVVHDIKCQPNDIISIKPGTNYRSLQLELCRVKFEKSNGKIKVQSKADTTDKSENIADAFIMAFYDSNKYRASIWSK